MPTTVKFRRGTTSQNDSFTGAAGELSIDETLDTIRVHDGSTAGGYEITQNAATQTLTNKTLTSPTIDGASIGGHLIPDANETYDLGSSSYKFRDLYLSGTSLNLGDATITASGSSVVLPSGTTIDGGSGAAVDLNSAQTLTNKTLTSPVISSISNTGTLTLPTSTGTVALTSDITLSTLSVTATASELNILDGVTATAAELNTLDGITSTTAELNLLDGVTATTTELNYVDGVTSNIQTQLDGKLSTSGGTISSNLTISGNLTVSGTTTTINTETINLADNTIVLNSNESGTPSENGGIEIERGTSTNKTLLWNETSDKWTVGSETFVAGTFEGNVTGNVTGDVTGNADTATTLATARTIAGQSFDGSANISIAPTDLTGVTATASELNILDGVTATATELNLLDGVTATTAELNYVDGVTSNIQTQLDAKGTVSSLSDLSITATAAEINKIDGFTGTYSDLNYAKDLNATGVTAVEFDYLDGVTSNIQTQFSGKQNTITGGASSITSSNLTATRAVVSDGSGKVAVSSVTSTELGYLDGVTSNVQTQINALPTSLSDLSVTATAAELNKLDGVTATTAELNILDGVTATAAELNYVDGVTSNVQTQLDAKVAKTSTTGSAILPVGTTAQRDGSPSAGYLRWNTTEGSAEVYDGSDWGSVGGGGAAETPYAEHANSISANYSIASGNNAVSGGPITVSSGYSVTVPSGSSWTIV